MARAARLDRGLASFITADPAKTSAKTIRANTPNTPSKYQRPASDGADQPIATMRSIGRRARAAISAGTLTSYRRSRSESRSFGRVIIFM